MASTVPVAGSAYTYAYATMGEFIAWLIGWDLILEYVVGATTVAIGWSGYVVSFLHIARHRPSPRRRDSVRRRRFSSTSVAPLERLSSIDFAGARHLQRAGDAHRRAWSRSCWSSASGVGAGQQRDRDHQGGDRPRVHRRRACVVIPQLVTARTGTARSSRRTRASSAQYGWSGIFRGAGVVFFAYIGFDAVSTAAQEAKNPQRDMPIGIIGSLAICTILYCSVRS